MNKKNGFYSYFSLSVIFLILTNNVNGMVKGEYPRPQFQREEWINLNGEWTFSLDNTRSGKEKGFIDSKGFEDKILVPFCPESDLSGVKHTDFIHSMWYHRYINIPSEWKGKSIILNFGGVDYYAEIYIDGKYLKSHYGGSSSFSIDISDHVKDGQSHSLVVYVEDDVRSKLQTTGKQSHLLHPYSCLYPRVTGIWQTVWIEAVDKEGLKFVKITPDLDVNQFVFEPQYFSLNSANQLEITILDGKKTVFNL